MGDPQGNVRATSFTRVGYPVQPDEILLDHRCRSIAEHCKLSFNLKSRTSLDFVLCDERILSTRQVSIVHQIALIRCPDPAPFDVRSKAMHILECSDLVSILQPLVDLSNSEALPVLSLVPLVQPIELMGIELDF